jgi:hypothetical protein
MWRDLLDMETNVISPCCCEQRCWRKAYAIRFGRKPKLTPDQRREAIARREAGQPVVDIGRSYNVSHSTISRLT